MELYMIRCTTTKYNHTHRAIIKALNKLLTGNLFKLQDMQELNNPEKVSSTWVMNLYGLIDQLYDTEMQMTGMKPKEVIELKKVPLVESYSQEDTLPEDGLYCYLLQPSEKHDDQKTSRLSEVRSSHGNRVLYCFAWTRQSLR